MTQSSDLSVPNAKAANNKTSKIQATCKVDFRVYDGPYLKSTVALVLMHKRMSICSLHVGLDVVGRGNVASLRACLGLSRSIFRTAGI